MKNSNLEIVFNLVLLLIITTFAFWRLLNNFYFPMHDDQQIVRLYLLDQGLRQGYFYPRWVGGLGFNFGYPLFNFYPPLVYYVGEFFHFLGFSLIWSVKLTFIFGFYLGALGIFLLAKKILNKPAAFLTATLYTYFFYHAVLIYVRGALAEFFSMTVLPFVFLAVVNLANKPNWKNTAFFAVSLAVLVLTHPLIALPMMIFLGFLFLFYFLILKFNLRFVYSFAAGFFLGLSLSAFFWLPSFFEKKYTLTDQILTRELADFKLHYIYPSQFWYSPWGYGGSGAGGDDGMTFQLGKVHIGLAASALFFWLVYLSKKRKWDLSDKYYLLFLFLLLFSLFMTTGYSSFIWEKLKYLWYLQFPWRFLVFAGLFISLCGGYFLFFIDKLLKLYLRPLEYMLSFGKPVYYFFTFLSIIAVIILYQRYFRPQYFIQTDDNERTSFEEVSWRISGTSYEFVPKGVKTKKTPLGTTILAINRADLKEGPYELLSGFANVKIKRNKFGEKIFEVEAESPFKLRLNTYNFLGWEAQINNQKVKIDDSNDFKLITIKAPKGKYELKFLFKNTPVRTAGNLLSILTFFAIIFLFFSNLDSIKIMKPGIAHTPLDDRRGRQ